MITNGSMAVLADSTQAAWIDQIGLSGDPGDYFLEETVTMPAPSAPGSAPAPVSQIHTIQVWLMTEGTASIVFTPAPGLEAPRAAATLASGIVDPATIVVNRS